MCKYVNINNKKKCLLLRNNDLHHRPKGQCFSSKVIKVMKRRCYGVSSVKSYFQRLWLDLNGYHKYGF